MLSKFFRDFPKIFEKFEKSENPKFSLIILTTDFSIFRKFSENHDFSENLENFRKISENFSIEILKSIFDQKFLVFFHELFLKPLLIFLENSKMKTRSSENVTRTRECPKRGDMSQMQRNTLTLYL